MIDISSLFQDKIFLVLDTFNVCSKS
uniref:Uncharacterized protein n=1 Tax=Rhizophora mucronata TaxID=61149 RepID=A0A2P2PUK2_RHIMU